MLWDLDQLQFCTIKFCCGFNVETYSPIIKRKHFLALLESLTAVCKSYSHHGDLNHGLVQQSAVQVSPGQSACSA